jgi:hypothetical protein
VAIVDIKNLNTDYYYFFKKIEFIHEENATISKTCLLTISHPLLQRILKCFLGAYFIEVQVSQNPFAYMTSLHALKALFKKEATFIPFPSELEREEWKTDRIKEVKLGKPIDWILYEEIELPLQKFKSYAAKTPLIRLEAFPDIPQHKRIRKIFEPTSLSPPPISTINSPFDWLKPNNSFDSFFLAVQEDLSLTQLFQQKISYEEFKINLFADKNFCDQYEDVSIYDAIVDQYIERFLAKHPEMNNPAFLPSLQFIALIITLKVSDDMAICNVDFFNFIPLNFSFSIKKVNRMEHAFLEAIQWNTWIDRDKVILK